MCSFTTEMVDAYQKVKSTGLTNIRLSNIGVFVRTEADQRLLITNVDSNAF